MKPYLFSNWGPKLRTFAHVKQRITNWPTVVGMRFSPNWQGLRLLHFREGLNLLCRGGTQDWDVVSALAVNDEYRLALDYLGRQKGQPLVLDMGANIGVFSLLAAQRSTAATIHAFEPAPANIKMFQLNLLANDVLASRIQLHPEAVGGHSRMAEFFYDAQNPQASRLESGSPGGFKVQIRAFAEVVNALQKPVTLAKMDIESAEYELIQETPAEVWHQIAAISIELHPTPNGPDRAQDFLKRIREVGFDQIAPESPPGCYFISRSRPLR